MMWWVKREEWERRDVEAEVWQCLLYGVVKELRAQLALYRLDVWSTGEGVLEHEPYGRRQGLPAEGGGGSLGEWRRRVCCGSLPTVHSFFLAGWVLRSDVKGAEPGYGCHGGIRIK